MDDFSKYEQMWTKEAKPEPIYLAAKADGLDPITLIRLVRKVCNLSLLEAKEVTITADRLASSLAVHQERFVPAIEKWVEQKQVDAARQADEKNGSEPLQQHDLSQRLPK